MTVESRSKLKGWRVVTDVPADLDDAGIFALVVLATIAVAAGLAYANITLWLTVPAFIVLAVGGEVAARALARIKSRQEVAE